MTEFVGGKTYNNSEIHCSTCDICANNYPTIPIATLYNYFEKKSGICCEKEKSPIDHYYNINHIVLICEIGVNRWLFRRILVY